MESIQSLLTTAVAEIEKILNSKTVVGEPITIADITLIPLVSVGFGFGTGGNGSTQGRTDHGGGTGGGGGVKPVGVIIIDKQGARLETIKGHSGSLMEKVAEIVSAGIEKSREGTEKPA
jgi:uncharacterized spore protein YtfJ